MSSDRERFESFSAELQAVTAIGMLAEAGRAVIYYTSHHDTVARFDQIEQYVLSAKSTSSGKSLLPGGRQSLEKLLTRMVRKGILSADIDTKQIADHTEFTLGYFGAIFAKSYRDVPKLVSWTENA